MAVPPQPVFADDNKKISTTYRALGLSWMHGTTRVTTKKFRASLCAACNPIEYPMLKVSQLECEYVDILVFVLAGVLPSSKVCDFGTELKRDCRAAVRQIYLSKMRKNRSRLDILSEELDNLPMVGLRLGYPVELMSFSYRKFLLILKKSAIK